ncbi:MAG TPA: glycoside hydrolase N-terminal domain-containing protein, partial [Vicinamibacterales bacterium]|nr:glycoside hydrolase N-terminal domain-containing protein [Vicinamibacterales bacterium]
MHRRTFFERLIASAAAVPLFRLDAMAGPRHVTSTLHGVRDGRGPSSDAARQVSGPGALMLSYSKPASKWVEALPVGNGRLGAMVFGTV